MRPRTDRLSTTCLGCCRSPGACPAQYHLQCLKVHHSLFAQIQSWGLRRRYWQRSTKRSGGLPWDTQPQSRPSDVGRQPRMKPYQVPITLCHTLGLPQDAGLRQFHEGGSAKHDGCDSVQTSSQSLQRGWTNWDMFCDGGSGLVRILHNLSRYCISYDCSMLDPRIFLFTVLTLSDRVGTGITSSQSCWCSSQGWGHSIWLIFWYFGILLFPTSQSYLSSFSIVCYFVSKLLCISLLRELLIPTPTDVGRVTV